MRKWLVPLLVIASMLIAAVPAAAAPPRVSDGGEPVFEYWGWDASCMYPSVGAYVYLGYGEDPAVGVDVTFSMEGQDPIVISTGEFGSAAAGFPFELGSDPVTIWIDAGEWGEASVVVSGPTPEVCEPVGSYSLVIACDGRSLTFEGKDGAYGWDFYVEYEDGTTEYFDLGGLVETFSHEFDQPIIWAEAWVYPESAEDVMDFFDIIAAEPGVCPQPEVRNNQYWLVDIYNPVLYDGWLDYCFAIMPQGYVPTDEWRGQPNHCGWTGGEVVYEGFVWLDGAGNPHYDGPGWFPEYYDPHYTGLYQNLETWNQAYLDSVQ